MKSIYLDYAAATPIDESVLATMQPYFSHKFQNPSATYLAARAVIQDLDAAREVIAQTLGCQPAEIVFTAGATEANNLALQGVARQFPDGEILYSSIEHESVIEPARLFRSQPIPVDNNGLVIPNRLADLISDKTVLVSVMLVNNELGTVQPLPEIARLIESVRSQRRAKKSQLPIYLHSDAAQAGNYLDLHVNRLGVDLMSLNGGKIYGPKQSGVLYLKAGSQLQPLIVGGGQEFGWRSGTENVAAAIGLAEALKQAQQKRVKESDRVSQLRQGFETKLQKQLPKALINGSKTKRAPHLISVSFPGQDNERLMMELDERGIQCAVGSACSASRAEASHVLAAIGLSEELARSTLRFSLGRFSDQKAIAETLSALHDLTALNR